MGVRTDKPIEIKHSYTDVSSSRFGIYGYFYKGSGQCLYIGKDSHIDINRRYLDHQTESRRDTQAINKKIQQTDIWSEVEYRVIALVADEEQMTELETLLIMVYRALGQCKYNGEVSLPEQLFNDILAGLPELRKLLPAAKAQVIKKTEMARAKNR